MICDSLKQLMPFIYIVRNKETGFGNVKIEKPDDELFHMAIINGEFDENVELSYHRHLEPKDWKCISSKNWIKITPKLPSRKFVLM